jgi:gluconate 2-dehydrogenase gamma chain
MTKQIRPISRREAIKKAGALAAATGAVTVAAGCATQATPEAQELPAVLRDTTPAHLKYPAVPLAPATPPEPGKLQVFSAQEARTVEALTARILPGSPEDPGAREAGVVVYIDHLLAMNEGFAEPTYRQAPFAQVYTGETPPEETYDVVWVASDQIGRYGFQSALTPREVYRMGLDAVDRYANSRFSRDFVDLTEDEQDSILSDMVEGRAIGFRQVSAEQFFLVLRRHTAEGMFSDPAYGGNRDLAGWKLIGFPGPQRAWTVAEIQTEGSRREPQSHGEMPPFNPGQDARDGAVMPLSGSDPHTWHDAHQHAPPTLAPTVER